MKAEKVERPVMGPKPPGGDEINSVVVPFGLEGSR